MYNQTVPIVKEEDKNLVYYQEDEIDLYELFLILKKRWKIIIISIVAILFIGLAYIFLSTPLYKIEANVKNIYINGAPANDISRIIALIKAKYYKEGTDRKNFFEENGFYLNDVNIHTVKRDKTDVFKITVYSISNQKGKEGIDKILNYIQAEYKPTLEKFVLNTKNKIEQLQEESRIIQNYKIKELERRKEFLIKEEIPLLKRKRAFLQEKVKNLNLLIKSYLSSINDYEKAIKNLSQAMKNPNLSNSSLLIVSNQIAQYENLITSLQNKIKNYQLEIKNIEQEQIPAIEKKIKEINEIEIKSIDEELENLRLKLKSIDRQIKMLELSLKPPLTENFKVLSENISDKPAKPKKMLIIAISIVSGLFLGIFLAFFYEWLQNAKNRRKLPEGSSEEANY
ncbi:Wzz/FepE/Etk N-terminal domain-containing protein [Persephonella sp. IF05-L8]|uniref:Wzz/FepE/Etk N-terminal domain-containing protein n=1 Tax=Persephonella sp. IF05-L8 TaxID=1158338 RepID=UPI000495D023